MADVSSARVFARALADAGLGSLASDFEKQGWITHGDFAYSCGVPPGQPEHDVRFNEEVVVRLTGERESVLKPKLRRLFHESWAYQLADLRRTTHSQEETVEEGVRRKAPHWRGCEVRPPPGGSGRARPAVVVP